MNKVIIKNIKYSAIMKKLSFHAKRHDILVGRTFYLHRLKKLNLTNSNIIELFYQCNKNYLTFMAIIRAEQLCLLDKQWIVNLIKNRKKLKEYEMEEIIFQVNKELYHLLNIPELKRLCKGNDKLFQTALRFRLKGMYKEDVYDYVYQQLARE